MQNQSEDPIITEEGFISEDPPADSAEVEPEYFDSSKLDSEDAKNMKRDVIICKTIEQVQALCEKKNIMKGMKPISEQEKLVEKPEDDVKIFKLPASLFEDFGEIDDNNEEMFEHLAFSVVIEFLNKTCGLEMAETEAHKQEPPKFEVALEFPDNIASMGRSILHEVGNYFGLSHHSAGKKGGKRRFIMYPKTLFKEK